MVLTDYHLKKLTYLQLLLRHLANLVPFCNACPTIYNFSVSKEDITDLGDGNSVVNRVLASGTVPRRTESCQSRRGVQVSSQLRTCYANVSQLTRVVDAPLSGLRTLSTESAEEACETAGEEVSDRVFKYYLGAMRTIHRTKSFQIPKPRCRRQRRGGSVRSPRTRGVSMSIRGSGALQEVRSRIDFPVGFQGTDYIAAKLAYISHAVRISRFGSSSGSARDALHPPPGNKAI